MPTGIPVSPGLALAEAVVLRNDELRFDRAPVAPEDIEAEVKRFTNGVASTVSQLEAIMVQVRENMGDEKATIFEGHLLLAEDEELSEAVTAKIRDQRFPAAAAVEEVTSEHAAALEQLEDEYLRARAVDMRDIGRRLILNCLGIVPTSLGSLEHDAILIADDLTPSQTAMLDAGKIKAIVTERGSRTSHTAIMAASMEIPAIVGVEGIVSMVNDGDTVAVDAEENQIIVNPAPVQKDQFEYRREQFVLERERLDKLREFPAVTVDGVAIKLAANIGSPSDTPAALEKGAEGIGLYRVEFLFMERSESPGEEDQYQAFKSVVDDMQGQPVVIRILDVGGDKDIPYLALPKEENPFLGCRGIRLCFERPLVMMRQLRALLRAALHGDIRILLPMISSVEEVRKFKEILKEARQSLAHEGIAYATTVPVGIMVETPAAVYLAPHLIREVDFFSIGTNDLTQYTQAVDRQNERIAALYESLSPAVLLSIKNTVDAACEEGKPVCVCGQMAGEVQSALLLVGIGVEELSMSPVHIPRVKNAIRGSNRSELREIARKVLDSATVSEVKSRLDKYLS